MSENLPLKTVAASWDALEDAFENNAPEVHSYLHLETGEVVRLVDGVADPALHNRMVSDSTYLRIDPVSSREQYRWMERFIATLEDAELRHKLFRAIDGKGAFRRFKDVLMTYPIDRERWFSFRSERVRACMESWLKTHSVEIMPRPEWPIPSQNEVDGEDVEVSSEIVQEGNMQSTNSSEKYESSLEDDFEPMRKRLLKLSENLPSYDLEIATSFLEFLTEKSFSRRNQSHTTLASSDENTEKGVSEKESSLPTLTKNSTTGSSSVGLTDGVLFASQLPPDPKGAN